MIGLSVGLCESAKRNYVSTAICDYRIAHGIYDELVAAFNSSVELIAAVPVIVQIHVELLEIGWCYRVIFPICKAFERRRSAISVLDICGVQLCSKLNM